MSAHLTNEQLSIKPGDSIPVRAAKISLKTGRRLKKDDDPAMVEIITSPPTTHSAPRKRITSFTLVQEDDAIREAVMEKMEEEGWTQAGKVHRVISPLSGMIVQFQEVTGDSSAKAAQAAISAIVNPATLPEIGERFLGTVAKTAPFGAFISLPSGKEGVLDISEIRKLVGGKRINAVEDVLSVGQKVRVELKEIGPRGRMSLAAVVEDEQSKDAGLPSASRTETTP